MPLILGLTEIWVDFSVSCFVGLTVEYCREWEMDKQRILAAVAGNLFLL